MLNLRLHDHHLWLTWLAFIIAIIAGTTHASNALSEITNRPLDDGASTRSIVKLLVYPKAIDLQTLRDDQTIVAQVVYSDGITEDVTSQISLEIENPVLLKNEANRFFPLADGQTRIIVQFDQHTVELPVSISRADVADPISFINDVMPVLSKTGCNAGSCHGSARGKDGFQLSLYGFDPRGDYYRLTREMLGRRINLATPDDCLLVNKAVGDVPHSGGSLFERDTEYYRTLLEWLDTGAVLDSVQPPAVIKVELYPTAAVLNGEGAVQQLTVLAHYADGSTRDVTSLSYFSTNNDNSADVSQAGLVTAANRGEAFVMARFDTHTVGSDFIVLPKDLEFVWQETTAYNYVDQLIHEKLKKLRIQPSEVCSDAEFIRRVSIDLCGVVPTPEELNAFVDDADLEKRSKLIDQLLDRKEFVEMWVMKWSELLQVRSTVDVSYKSTLLYYDWLRSRIANEQPINQMVLDLLSAQGGTFSQPETNYYQTERDNLKLSENVAQVFLGMRLQCAQCHNHPFDRWTMDDYYGFAAFFAQVGRKGGSDPREVVVYDRRSGETQHPVTNQPVKPKFLGEIEPEMRGKDRRQVLAEWIASPDNPYFADNLANIVWAHFFGRGIVDEVDDVRISNPPVNLALLNRLGEELKASNYDFKSLVRDICNSRTYQLSTKTNPTNKTDLTNFSHAHLRRMRAEVLLDVISQITETENKFTGLPRGARAVQIADGNTSDYFLTTFGRAKRESVCSCEVSMEPNLSQALHFLNGATIHQKIIEGKIITRRLEAGQTAKQVLQDLFLRCLGRVPTAAEQDALLAQIDAEENIQLALEDVFWSILNSSEFLFNH